MNHFLCERRAAFQSAMPFQGIDHNIPKTSHKDKPLCRFNNEDSIGAMIAKK